LFLSEKGTAARRRRRRRKRQTGKKVVATAAAAIAAHKTRKRDKTREGIGKVCVFSLSLGHQRQSVGGGGVFAPPLFQPQTNISEVLD
jgi:hypothetical protein